MHLYILGGPASPVIVANEGLGRDPRPPKHVSWWWLASWEGGTTQNIAKRYTITVSIKITEFLSINWWPHGLKKSSNKTISPPTETHGFCSRIRHPPSSKAGTGDWCQRKIRSSYFHLETHLQRDLQGEPGEVDPWYVKVAKTHPKQKDIGVKASQKWNGI